ncbi:MAG: hypothetical protein LBV02_04690 [Bacteroidales bacterium]|jgi:hypothetical protein|nr:hypothetical protein [Bacteroidales bacterium]
MKKFTLLFVIGLLMTATAFAQKPARENIPIDKQILPGFSLIVSDLDVGVVESAMADYLAKQGLVKPGKLSGFAFYGNQNIPKIGTLHYDIYTKVVQEGKKKANKVKVYFVATKGNMNPLTETADREVMDKIMVFLEEFTTHARGYAVGKNVEALEKDLAKQQKQLTSATKKRDKQQSKIDKMTKDLNNRQTQIGTTQSDLNKAKMLLQQYNK